MRCSELSDVGGHHPLVMRRWFDVESTSLTLIQRRNNVVCPVEGTVQNTSCGDTELVQKDWHLMCLFSNRCNGSKLSKQQAFARCCINVGPAP